VRPPLPNATCSSNLAGILLQMRCPAHKPCLIRTERKTRRPKFASVRPHLFWPRLPSQDVWFASLFPLGRSLATQRNQGETISSVPTTTHSLFTGARAFHLATELEATSWRCARSGLRLATLSQYFGLRWTAALAVVGRPARVVRERSIPDLGLRSRQPYLNRTLALIKLFLRHAGAAALVDEPPTRSPPRRGKGAIEAP
jgi:hypothetical protein